MSILNQEALNDSLVYVGDTVTVQIQPNLGLVSPTLAWDSADNIPHHIPTTVDGETLTFVATKEMDGQSIYLTDEMGGGDLGRFVLNVDENKAGAVSIERIEKVVTDEAVLLTPVVSSSYSDDKYTWSYTEDGVVLSDNHGSGPLSFARTEEGMVGGVSLTLKVEANRKNGRYRKSAEFQITLDEAETKLPVKEDVAEEKEEEEVVTPPSQPTEGAVTEESESKEETGTEQTTPAEGNTSEEVVGESKPADGASGENQQGTEDATEQESDEKETGTADEGTVDQPVSPAPSEETSDQAGEQTNESQPAVTEKEPTPEVPPSKEEKEETEPTVDQNATETNTEETKQNEDGAAETQEPPKEPEAPQTGEEATPPATDSEKQDDPTPTSPTEDQPSEEDDNTLAAQNIPAELNVVATEGDQVTIGNDVYILEGEHVLTTSWTKDGVAKPEYKFNTVVLTSATVADSGIYVRTLTLGEETAITTITVTVGAASTPQPEEPIVPPTPEEETGIRFDLDQTNLGIVHEGDKITISSVTEGNVLSLNTIGAPEGYVLQWYCVKDGVTFPIEGATSPRLELSITNKYNGELFLRATNGTEIIDSPHAVIAKFVPIKPTVVSQDITLTKLEHDSVDYSIEVVPQDEETVIRWFHTSIAGTTNELINNQGRTQLHIEPISMADEGTYYAQVERLGTTVVSKRLTLLVEKAQERVIFNISLDQAGTITMPTGRTFLLNATVDGATEQTNYQWYRSRNGQITPVEGANTSTLTLTDLTVAQSGHYYLVVEQGQSRADSDSVYLDVVPQLPDNLDMDPKEPTLPDQGDLTDEQRLALLGDKEGIGIFSRSIEQYCQRMQPGANIKPQDGVILQTSFYRDILRILNIKEIDLYMDCMDMLVDYFWVYRKTVFAPDYRFRFMNMMTKSLMSVDDQDAFMTFVNLFASMADPLNSLPVSLAQVEDNIDNPVAYTRLVDYYNRKVETRKEASLKSSSELASQYL